MANLQLIGGKVESFSGLSLWQPTWRALNKKELNWDAIVIRNWSSYAHMSYYFLATFYTVSSLSSPLIKTSGLLRSFSLSLENFLNDNFRLRDKLINFHGHGWLKTFPPPRHSNLRTFFAAYRLNFQRNLCKVNWDREWDPGSFVNIDYLIRRRIL